MASLTQLRKVSELLQNGWHHAAMPANIDPENMPCDGPTELVGPDRKSYLVGADGSVTEGKPDWDKYCTGGKADWSARPPMI